MRRVGANRIDPEAKKILHELSPHAPGPASSPRMTTGGISMMHLKKVVSRFISLSG